tara:strand:+ start:71 stop:1618 length:1548 start_codon:yes stop_codon:yes gene_type:complete
MGSGRVRIEKMSSQSRNELEERSMRELQQLQTTICSSNLLGALLTVISILGSSMSTAANTQIKSGLESELESTSTSISTSESTAESKSKRVCITLTNALDAVAAIVCGCESNQTMMLSCNTVLPWGVQRVVTNVGSLAVVLDVYTSVQSTNVHMAALGVLNAFFCLNDDAKISFVGHAIAPPPADLDSEQDRGLPHSDSPGRMIVEIFTQSASLFLSTNVSIVDRGMAQFQLYAACDVLETICSENVTCKELLLRVKASKHMTKNANVDTKSTSMSATLTNQNVEQEFFLNHCFRLIRATMIEDVTHTKGNIVAARLLRLVAIWGWNCTAVVDTIFQSATQLSVLASLFNKNKGTTTDPSATVFGALLVGVCVATGSGGSETQKKSVFGFVENVLGVENLHDMLDRATSSSVERNIVDFVKRIRSVVTEKLVERYTSGNGSGNSGGKSCDGEVERLREKVRKLEEEKRSTADLFVLLAHLDLENRVLVKHLQRIGGGDALNLAKEEARRLLQKTK